jgi:preprotein translocase subunit SecE
VSAKSELKKVSWPTKKEITKHTIMVIGVSLGVAFFLGALDILFSKILALIIS